jgi:hypothetical protein
MDIPSPFLYARRPVIGEGIIAGGEVRRQRLEREWIFLDGEECPPARTHEAEA